MYVDQVRLQDLRTKIENAHDCSDLVEWVEKEFVIWVEKLTLAMAGIEVIVALCEIPTSLSEVIERISNFIGKYLSEYYKLMAAIVEIVAAYALITSAVLAKLGNMVCGAITIPALPSTGGLPTPP